MTCDQYMQQPYAPGAPGGKARTSTILDLLQAHNLNQLSIPLGTKVERAIDSYCGDSNPAGGVNAQRNNDQPIDNAVDWSTITSPT